MEPIHFQLNSLHASFKWAPHYCVMRCDQLIIDIKAAVSGVVIATTQSL